ncbi:serine/threonine-protein kinase [Streptomyces sp. BPTC-684]|uniref:serine/threonine-protein kinase n=1 Tax=Streptomyces sp. BPTC-684 TaxID=3043734 RepID=UPI0024B0EC41|nr:serine/threonine-protein kinase [Streptomyces sp. BPTC-684]WHM39464.1 serine/threonine-protein kinase [Streptomyces sp. BPTC-684]
MSEVPGNEERVIGGRYRLLSPLGRGGMGEVWRARDEVLGREVAVKEVRAPAGLDSIDEQRLYARLEREAWAAARISHRNVVTVYDVATQDSRPWIVMELVRGLSLSDVLEADGPLSPQRAGHIGAEIVAALRAAHEAGVLHRDVKPANVLLANDGRVVLTDFGIAMVAGTSTLTMTGEVIGSPEFLSPEQALGRTPGPASDLWSLGVLLYAAVEGSTPFRQATPLSTLRAVVDDELPPPRRAGALAPVIAGLLRKDPAERLSTEEAEHQLRVVGAGGEVRDVPPPYPGAYGPTVTSPRTPPLPTTPVTPGAYGPETSNPSTGRQSRAGVVLLIGALVLLLALVGLAWALTHNGGGGDKNAGTPSAPGPVSHSTPRSSTATKSHSATSATTGPTGTPSSSPSSSAPPAQSVKVSLQTVRGSYEGTCPPPDGSAPAVVATFTVGRTPVEVQYRWVTAAGESSDPGWKTLSFGSGDPKNKQVQHIESGYEAGKTVHNAVQLEVRSPVAAHSDSVSYSVTCKKEETPTGGASSSSTEPAGGGSGSPAGQSWIGRRDQAAPAKVGR